MLKKILARLFKKKDDLEETASNFVVAQLNEKVGPIDRSLVYEEPLDEFLQQKQYGEVTGGGTLQEKTGELSSCDIEIELASDMIDQSIITEIIEKLEFLGAPKGSKLLVEKTGAEIPFGRKEGLAVYLDAQNLPEEVYKECDINFVLSTLHQLTNIEPDADRNWQGEKETALYFFGDSFAQMKNNISAFIDTYPLCKGARIVQIA